MRLDTITRIEQFIVDMLLSSPQIPLGVNVVRLAAAQETEGITNMARTIIVRYTGSSVTVTNQAPLVTERRMNFQIDLAAQEYLTESGHDYVIQMCAGAYNTLVNQVPPNTGVEVVEAFTMSDESFQGLTDNSQYVYTQNWNVITQQTNPQIAVDPCVARGNCSYLFPSNTVQTILPGDVLYGNSLYAPVMPLDTADKYNQKFCGVEVRGLDLVYKYDTDKVFLPNWEQYSLVSTDTFDVSKQFLIVNIYEKGDRSRPVGTYYASNCDDRKVIQIAGQQPAYAGSMFMSGMMTSSTGGAGDPVQSSVPETLPAVMAQKNGYGWVYTDRATVYGDPANPNGPKAQVRYGTVFSRLIGVDLTIDDVPYYYIGGTPIGKAWIRQDQWRELTPPPFLGCEEPSITPGVPEGTDPVDSGPITSCD